MRCDVEISSPTAVTNTANAIILDRANMEISSEPSQPRCEF